MECKMNNKLTKEFIYIILFYFFVFILTLGGYFLLAYLFKFKTNVVVFLFVYFIILNKGKDFIELDD